MKSMLFIFFPLIIVGAELVFGLHLGVYDFALHLLMTSVPCAWAYKIRSALLLGL